ncbi:MAG TPA: CsgG/HfaB family protein [Tepidisphaeraceae bacterium]
MAKRWIAPCGQTRILLFILAACALGGCQAAESNRVVETRSVDSRSVPYTGTKRSLVIGKVQNRSQYMNGIFSDGVDRLGTQARQILMTHLNQSQRFRLMDRANMEELSSESKFSGATQKIIGAEYVLTGAVTEFGRRETGSQALGGAFGKTRKQTAYAKVSLTVVDVRTSEAVWSVQGAGEFDLDTGEVVGFGSTAGYDATLTDKVLNLAMIDVVNKLVRAIDAGEWGTAK